MAQQALTRVLMMLGGGSLLVTTAGNGSLSDALRSVAGLLSGGSRGSDGSLNNKVDHLAQEMRDPAHSPYCLPKRVSTTSAAQALRAEARQCATATGT